MFLSLTLVTHFTNSNLNSYFTNSNLNSYFTNSNLNSNFTNSNYLYFVHRYAYLFKLDISHSFHEFLRVATSKVSTGHQSSSMAIEEDEVPQYVE